MLVKLCGWKDACYSHAIACENAARRALEVRPFRVSPYPEDGPFPALDRRSRSDKKAAPTESFGCTIDGGQACRYVVSTQNSSFALYQLGSLLQGFGGLHDATGFTIS